MHRLAISQITTAPLTLGEDLALCQRLGCGLEIAEKKLSRDPGQARDQLAMIKDSGVPITSIQPRTLTLFPSASAKEPAEPQARLELLAASVELFAPYWPGLALLSNTGADPEGNEAKVWDGCLEHYASLARHAASHGMRIALEALGPSLMNRNSILFSFSQAQEMVRAVDHPHLGLCLDLYNSWQDPALLSSISADQLFIVQVADWRRPRSLHDRRALGDGELALAPLLGSLANAGYDGDYVLEIFSEGVADSLWRDKPTLMAAVERSAEIFNTLAWSIDS
ncbi:sugar phosphate isomerase/epimerase family protein [Pseudomonas sp. HR96]|uniref:sugar phosphate isomerase/epimerase family protein n=1 Tax=Pseudomonas sp. HR96 TaxID=1027966 RepID=UPI002A753A58|nr:sugar phosphate isomerase/epimerase family protein [Pseudomonas sp. HR96]WPP01419.1 sugar phosphate isomerase/epimerase family protein [Pseudomonas sp. HR96]